MQQMGGEPLSPSRTILLLPLAIALSPSSRDFRSRRRTISGLRVGLTTDLPWTAKLRRPAGRPRGAEPDLSAPLCFMKNGVCASANTIGADPEPPVRNSTKTWSLWVRRTMIRWPPRKPTRTGRNAPPGRFPRRVAAARRRRAQDRLERILAHQKADEESRAQRPVDDGHLHLEDVLVDAAAGWRRRTAMRQTASDRRQRRVSCRSTIEVAPAKRQGRPPHDETMSPNGKLPRRQIRTTRKATAGSSVDATQREPGGRDSGALAMRPAPPSPMSERLKRPAHRKA